MSLLRRLAACAFVLAAFPAALSAQNGKENADLLRLEAAFQPADPFDEFYSAKNGSKTFEARPGEIVRLFIRGVPKAGHYTYPLTVRTSVQDEGQLSNLDIDVKAGVLPLWPVQESEPYQTTEETIGLVFKHVEPFVWSLEMLVSPDAKPGTLEVPITVSGQVCSKVCVKVKETVVARLVVGKEKPLTLTSETSERLNLKKPAVKVVDVKDLSKKGDEKTAGLISGTPEEYKAAVEKIQSQIVLKQKDDAGLLAFILAGVFWGFISLITPCVFPMIPITVSYFLKQSEKEHHRPLGMALVYCSTIIVVLTLAAAFLLSAFRFLSINPIMNYALGGLFVFFALSLFGMYDIELPSGLARFTSAREGKGGYLGTVFMALTFTIISFACVAPFLGGFGGTAGGTPRPFGHILLGGLAFSATFAAPFFFLALFPTLLRKMPKSGSWLNSVKVVMGFLELAAAFKFFRAAELVHSSAPSLFTYDFVLGIWIALCFLCGLYLLQVYRLPHDTPEETIGVPRLLFAGTFLGLGIYFLPALFKVDSEGVPQRPAGTVYAWVDAFLLPESRPAKGELVRSGNLEYAVNKALEERKRTGKPKRIFVDLTGKS